MKLLLLYSVAALLADNVRTNEEMEKKPKEMEKKPKALDLLELRDLAKVYKAALQDMQNALDKPQAAQEALEPNAVEAKRNALDTMLKNHFLRKKSSFNLLRKAKGWIGLRALAVREWGSALDVMDEREKLHYEMDYVDRILNKLDSKILRRGVKEAPTVE